MTRLKKIIFAILIGAIFHLLAGCGDEPRPSFFDPNEPSNAVARVTAIDPPDSTLAGVGELRIIGENFSGNADLDVVFFNTRRATIVSASPTELVVRTPNIISDSIAVRVASFGSIQFSETVLYALKPAVVEFGSLADPGQDVAEAFSLAVDLDENVYVSTGNRRIKKVAPNGTTTLLTSDATFLRANGMRMGPGSTIYAAVAAGRRRFVATITPDAMEASFATFRANPNDLDFDANGNIWVAVEADINLVKPDGSTSTVSTFPVTIFGVRVFDGFLYTLGGDAEADEHKIWRSEIQGETLGSPEVVFDFQTATWLAGASVTAMAASADGVFYLGTDHSESGVFVVEPGGSGEVLYAGLIPPRVNSLSWGNDRFLYATIETPETGKLLKIDTQRLSAPYFGRQ